MTISFKTLKKVGTTPTNSVAFLARPANTTAYTAGDVISEVTTNDHFSFLGCGMAPELSGMIDGLLFMINSNPTNKPALELWLFDTDIAKVADNSAFAPTDTEIRTLVDIIDIPANEWKVGLAGADAAGNICQVMRNINLPFRNTGGDDQTLFGQLVVRNTYTPISGEEFTVNLLLDQD